MEKRAAQSGPAPRARGRRSERAPPRGAPPRPPPSAPPPAHARASGRTCCAPPAKGARLGAIPSTWNREPVPLAHVSPWLPKATVAIEDRRFWTRQSALDLEAITRAAVADYRAGRSVQGGSTLAQ